jgi:hypothetical protein
LSRSRWNRSQSAAFSPWRFDVSWKRRATLYKGETTMPATSQAQQKAAGAALSAKRGETKKSELLGASREMYESMSEKQLEEFAETKRKSLPKKKS